MLSFVPFRQHVIKSGVGPSANIFLSNNEVVFLNYASQCVH